MCVCVCVTDDNGGHVDAQSACSAGKAGESSARRLDSGRGNRSWFWLSAGVLWTYRSSLERQGSASMYMFHIFFFWGRASRRSNKMVFWQLCVDRWRTSGATNTSWSIAPSTFWIRWTWSSGPITRLPNRTFYGVAFSLPASLRLNFKSIRLTSSKFFFCVCLSKIT